MKKELKDAEGAARGRMKYEKGSSREEDGRNDEAGCIREGCVKQEKREHT